MIRALKKELREMADPDRAKLSDRYFKTGPGGYAEGDRFLGLTMPNQRYLIKKYWQNISMAETQELLQGKFHEERMLALLIMVAKFEKGDEALKKEIFELYLANTRSINNWDLVDVTAPKIVGAYLEGKDCGILFKLAKSKNLWERRIAILATLRFIANGRPELSLEIAELLVNDKEDLIHKALGWMLREIGKRCDQEAEEQFLRKHCKTMPRTMLRYAIEKFDDKKRACYMKK
jgi:3-methyladenine DNA glycosylase AlkD